MKEVREIGSSEGKSQYLSKSIHSIFKHIIDEVNPRMILIGVGIGILITVGFYLVARFTIPSITGLNKILKMEFEEVTQSSESKVEEKKVVSNIVELNVSLKTGLFNQKRVIEYVPYDVDLYLEFNGFDSFEPYFNFMGGEVFTLSENIKDKVNPFFSAFLATRDGKQYWTFIMFPTKLDLNPGTYKDFYSEIVGEALVISTNQIVLTDIKSAKAGTMKSLALNSSYVSTRNTIPVEGKMLLFTFSDGGKNAANDLLVKTTSEELKLIIEAFKILDSNYMVVK